MSADPYLAQELVDEILQHLGQDKRSLGSCALVARSWTTPSRKFLFNHIDLKPAHQITNRKTLESDLEALLQALNRTPYLPRYVHHLTIDFRNYNYAGTRVSRKLIYILSILTSLQSVDMGIGRWNDFSPEMASACDAILSLPSLSSVTLRNGKFVNRSDLTDLLLKLQFVSKLWIHDIDHLSPFYGRGIQSFAPIPYLRELGLKGPFTLMDLPSWLLAGRTKTQLERIIIQEPLSRSNIESIRALLDLSGESLRELDLVSSGQQIGTGESSIKVFIYINQIYLNLQERLCLVNVRTSNGLTSTSLIVLRMHHIARLHSSSTCSMLKRSQIYTI